MEIPSAELGELQRSLSRELEKYYPAEELKAILQGLFFHVTGLTPGQMVLEKHKLLSESDIFFLQRAVRRLKDHEPLQYITRKAYFRGLEFFVDHHVLIPRPETEELVDWVLEVAGLEAGLKVLDIGTGSGCIAISVKKEAPGADVYAVDISSEALAVANKNASTLQGAITFIKLDILNAGERSSLPHFDVIISNPPYVTPDDRKMMQRNVTEHEPGVALFVEANEPLIFYREIIQFSKDHLLAGGKLFFECNEGNARDVATLLSANGFMNIEIRHDFRGKERMVMGIGDKVSVTG